MAMSRKLVQGDLLDTLSITKLSIQRLQPEFVQLLRDNDYEVLTLCGDNGRTKMLLILNTDDPVRSKLGYEWDEFCASNLLQIEDIIKFKIDVTDTHGTCHVYKELGRSSKKKLLKEHDARI
ncbi:uncharacterized protein LOC131620358 isoform X2 [Vicia villosa]|uniref:uncharacterized protein LOC131620358 isoform X2 n=1 Tax=Vicia villosa TaxID=3911 RepID=UPI00273B5C11|nr:uncharacterized protein LOC131620358 isoform X2 [Vicia villosa]